MKTIVVAFDKNLGIGAANDLLWQHDLPADLQHFKAVTTGGAIIMGRKTFDSIGRPLPGRQNIVITHGMEAVDGVTIVGSLEAAYAAVESGREIFIIGGGQIYTQAIGVADKIIATEVDAEFDDADVFFPKINPSSWHDINRVHHNADEHNRYNYDFVTYVRY